MTLRLVQLHKRFGKTDVLDGVDLVVEPNEIHAVIGVSGSGKSTLLRIISGLTAADRGDVYWRDVPLGNLPAHKRNITILSQSALLFPHLTAGENVALACHRKNREEAERWLETVHLKDRYDAEVHELSGGEQQRVSLARALAARPEVLLLDEPFTNLDPRLKYELQRFIRDLVKELNLTTILVTHDREEAMLMADRLSLLKDGKVSQTGTTDQLYETSSDFGEFVTVKGRSLPATRVIVNEMSGDPVVLKRKLFRFGQLFGEYQDADGTYLILPSLERYEVDETYYIRKKEE